MKKIALFALIGLLTSCANAPMALPLQPVNSLYPFQAGLRSMNQAAPARQIPFGKGARVEGTEPMQDDGGIQNFGLMASLPPRVDLRPQMSPVYNQGQTNACVGYSTVGGLGEYYARKRGWNMPFAPRYLWNMGRKMEHSLFENQGMYLEQAIKVMDAYGMIPEQEFPMQTTDPQGQPVVFKSMISQLPSNQLIQKAKKYRISQGWKRIPSVRSMRKALSEGKPVVFAMMTYSNLWQSWDTGNIPMPGPQDQMQGGHAIVAVGYDNAQRHFIIRNSWGTEWGDGGYGYLPYDYFRNDLKIVPVYAGFTIK